MNAPPSRRRLRESVSPQPLQPTGQVVRLTDRPYACGAGRRDGIEEDYVIARIATFEGGDAEEMRRINNEMLVERSSSLPSGLLRVMV